MRRSTRRQSLKPVSLLADEGQRKTSSLQQKQATIKSLQADTTPSTSRRKVKFGSSKDDTKSPTTSLHQRKNIHNKANVTINDAELMDDTEANDETQLTQFDDEVNQMSTTTAIENYFNLGRIRDVTLKRSSRKKKCFSTDRELAQDTEENVNPNDQIECDLEQLRDWLKISDKYSTSSECTNTSGATGESLAKWMNYLLCGFNLMFYGIGSKRALLQAFCDEFLSDLTHVVVDAFYPSVTTRIILQCLEANLNLKNRSKRATVTDWAASTAEAIGKRNEDIFLIIHNIDGPDMRDDTQQLALSELAKCSRVHIIASFDHFNAPLLWTQEMLNPFNFVFINVDTMLAYKEELFASESKLLGLNAKTSGRAHSQASLDVLWASLTFNSRMVLHKLAKLYYARKQAIEFFDLYRQSREDFLVSSETALRQQLIELDDHHLISKKRHDDGNEYVSLTVDYKLMKTFLESKGLIMDIDDNEGDNTLNDN